MEQNHYQELYKLFQYYQRTLLLAQLLHIHLLYTNSSRKAERILAYSTLDVGINDTNKLRNTQPVANST